MKEQYRILDSDDNLKLSLSLPEAMVRDLAARAEENGRDVNIEVMIRLSRSLERDNEMLTADRIMENSFHWQPATEQ